MTKQRLDRAHTSGSLSIRGMLEMRTTGMAWSSCVPLSLEKGEGGSMLAVSNRAGMVALWV